MEATTGQIFECIRSNRKHGAIKGRFYVYNGGELRTYTTRNVTILINGDEMLDLDGVFREATKCPFCDLPHPNDAEHDGEECAADWDARVKKYERSE